METLDALVGRRVALRHRVGERDGRPLYTDAVGELAAGGAGEVVVHTRRGAVTVERAAVVAVRAIPPARPRRPSWAAVQRLEAICAAAGGADVSARVALDSPAEVALRRQGVTPAGEEVEVLVADVAGLPARLPAGHAVVVDEHVRLSELGTGVVDVPRTGAGWAVVEVPAADPAAAAPWHELGFVSHHRARYLRAGSGAASSTPPSPPA
ncbi:MAG: GCN5-related N-acetyltransferase [Pseudonocardia sp.]|nr:GCN5-related N-acetyltransferase [Pseudonocardia sp.]